MAENQLSELVDLVVTETSGLEPREWPVEDLNELAFDIVAEGNPVQAISTRRYDVMFVTEDETNEMTSIVRPIIGQVATHGFFRGFQRVQYIETDLETNTEFEIDELTVRLETLDDQIRLVPLVSLENIEAEDTDPINVLGYDDVLNEIDTLVCNETIDLGKLVKLFSEMDIEDMRTSLYLDYLNIRLSLEKIYSALTTKQILYLTEDFSGREVHDETVMATFAKGKSFCLIGVEKDDGTSTNMLCINAEVGEHDAIVPVSDDMRFLGKL